MCGRFFLTADSEVIATRFALNSLIPEWKPRYNMAPGQPVLAVITEKEQRKLVAMAFGFILHRAKAKPKGFSLINARAETLSQQPSFRNSYKTKRCLIPADSFYEWGETDQGKLPYRVTLKSEALFAFAGIWDTWLVNSWRHDSPDCIKPL